MLNQGKLIAYIFILKAAYDAFRVGGTVVSMDELKSSPILLLNKKHCAITTKLNNSPNNSGYVTLSVFKKGYKFVMDQA